MQQKVYFNLQY